MICVCLHCIEERWVARRLADMGVPIVKCIRGNATFEGADAMWLRPDVAIVGRGLRTNDEGAAQVASILTEMGVEVVQVGRLDVGLDRPLLHRPAERAGLAPQQVSRFVQRDRSAGLGQPVLRSITNQYFALGLLNGLAIVVLAIIFDRVSQAYAKRSQQYLGGRE